MDQGQHAVWELGPHEYHCPLKELLGGLLLLLRVLVVRRGELMDLLVDLPHAHLPPARLRVDVVPRIVRSQDLLVYSLLLLLLG